MSFPRLDARGTVPVAGNTIKISAPIIYRFSGTKIKKVVCLEARGGRDEQYLVLWQTEQLKEIVAYTVATTTRIFRKPVRTVYRRKQMGLGFHRLVAIFAAVVSTTTLFSKRQQAEAVC